jgi:hypothetical protein
MFNQNHGTISSMPSAHGGEPVIGDRELAASWSQHGLSGPAQKLPRDFQQRAFLGAVRTLSSADPVEFRCNNLPPFRSYTFV